MDQPERVVNITGSVVNMVGFYTKSENGSVYTIIPQKSRISEKGFVIQSNFKTLSQTWEMLLNDQVTLKWLSFRGLECKEEIPDSTQLRNIIASIGNVQRIKDEIIDDSGEILSPGLRPPQIGAIYSILSSWSTSKDIITVVLPTGTGKSESILGAIIANKISQSLIIVPSDGLREQFFKNSQTWGILRKLNIIDETVHNPIVLSIASSPKDGANFMKMLCSCNIAIATTSILNKLPQEYIKQIAEFDAIFIDEAHHSAAPTWENLKGLFSHIPIVQFTATPFREDKKPIAGKIVFNYSLEQAQKNNYFTKIEFVPVIDYDEENWDKTISEKAIEILRKDLADGNNHFLMARVDNIPKANDIFNKYYAQYAEFNPILVTSKSPDVNEKIRKLRNGESRIVVCVNMLGEGIDIPELKIAALHDIRKSLTITLQFVGRFTRSNKSKSPAKIIANIADVEIEKKLKQLYKEDADWGKLIAFASAKEIQKKIKFQEILANFKNSKLPLFNIKPKMSAVVYKTKTDQWSPEQLEMHFSDKEKLFICDTNMEDNIAIAIFQEESNIDWLDSNVFVESTWELLLFYFDNKRQLLYVNSSLKDVDINLVHKLARIDRKFETEEPFKCYGGLGYVVLFTLGLDKNTDSPIKYAMYAGDDVYNGISDMEKNKSSKSNTYGYGFSEGIEITLGASKKGKVWSRLVGNIQEWKEWCDSLGNKLLDTTIDVNEIFKGFLQPRRFNLADYHNLCDPVSIDWPSIFYQENESVQYLLIDELIKKELNEIDIFVTKNSLGYKVQLIWDGGTCYLNLIYLEDGFSWEIEGYKKIEYAKKSKVYDFLSYLKNEDPFKIRLEDGTFIENNYHFKPYNQESIFPLNTDLITQLDWSGVSNTEVIGPCKTEDTGPAKTEHAGPKFHSEHLMTEVNGPI